MIYKKFARGSNYQWFVLFMAFLLALVGSTLYLVPSPLITSIMAETGWDIAQTGQLISIIMLFLGIFSIVGQVIMEKLGMRTTLILGFGMVALGGILPGFAPMDYTVNMVGRVIFAIGFGLTTNVPIVVMASWFTDPAKLSLAQGFRQSLSYLTLALPVYVALPIYKAVGSWGNTSMVCGVAALIVLIIAIFTFNYPEGYVVEKKVKVKKSFKENGIVRAFARRSIQILFAVQILKTFALNTFTTYEATYLELQLGFTKEAAASVSGTMQLWGMIAGMLMGTISAKLGRRKILTWPMLSIMLLGIVGVLFFTSNMFTAMLFTACIGFGNCGFAILNVLTPLDWEDNDPDLYNGCLAICIGIPMLPAFILPKLLKALLPTLGYTWSIAVMSCLLIPAIIVSVFLPESGPAGKKKLQGN